MARYRTTVRTSLSTDEAFSRIADFRTVAEWDPGVSSSTLPSGVEPGVGATYSVKAGFVDLEYETLEFDPPTRTVLEAVSSTLRSYDVISFAPVDGGGTDVTYDATLELRGLLSPFGLGLGLVFDRIGDKAAAGLAKHLTGEIVSS